MRNFSIPCKLAGALYWMLGEPVKGRYLDVGGGYVRKCVSAPLVDPFADLVRTSSATLAFCLR